MLLFKIFMISYELTHLTAAVSYFFRMWGQEGSRPYIQAYMFSISLGSTMSPIIGWSKRDTKKETRDIFLWNLIMKILKFFRV